MAVRHLKWYVSWVLKRRETVWSLSAVGVGDLTGLLLVRGGPEWTHLWCTGCDASRIAG